jgi:hypothetical protein
MNFAPFEVLTAEKLNSEFSARATTASVASLSTAQISANQTITGLRTHTKQLDSISADGFGLTSPAAYIYSKQANQSADTVGDVRIYNWDGTINSQRCTVAGATKGGGTWSTIPSLVGSWETAYSATIEPSQLIIDATQRDVTQWIASLGEVRTSGSPVYYLASKQRFQVDSSTVSYYNFTIRLRASATISGGTNNVSEFVLELRRGDGTTILPSKKTFIKVSGGSNTIVNETIAEIFSRVFGGGGDPFQDAVSVTGGFKVFMYRISGNATLTFNFNNSAVPKIGNTVLFSR